MPEFRMDTIHGKWVIVAPERSNRPQSFAAGGAGGAINPFLPGNEYETPPEVACVRVPGSKEDAPGWKIRVFDNRYPVLIPTGEYAPTEEFECLNAKAYGIHEVVVETPDPETPLEWLEESHVREVVEMWASRMEAIRVNDQIAQGLVFKNFGAAGGASLSHAHSQVIGFPFIAPDLMNRVKAQSAYVENHQMEWGDGMIQQERETGDRLVWQDDHVVVYCPHGSRFACEMRLIPVEQGGDFGGASAQTIDSTARAIRSCLRALRRLNITSYNLLVYTAPFREEAKGYRWHIEIYPRVAGLAGIEIGAGIFINTLHPELAARRLRESMT